MNILKIDAEMEFFAKSNISKRKPTLVGIQIFIACILPLTCQIWLHNNMMNRCGEQERDTKTGQEWDDFLLQISAPLRNF
jgi:hypothetical protein